MSRGGDRQSAAFKAAQPGVVDEAVDDEVAGHAPEWLVDRAHDLVVGIREREPQVVVEQYTADLSWAEIRALLVVAAAMCPADVDPQASLEWLDVQPSKWSSGTVVRESGRWDTGARDYTAARGRGQWITRRADAALAAGGAA